MAKKKTLAEGWSISEDCLRPIGRHLISLSSELNRILDIGCSPSKSSRRPQLPSVSLGLMAIRTAFSEHKLDLAIVLLEVAVSVPFADRVRERTELVRKRFDELISFSYDALEPEKGEIQSGELIRVALEREFEIERTLPHDGESIVFSEETCSGLACDVAAELEDTGVYLVRVASALKHVFVGNSLTKAEADSAPPARLGRPKERIKRELIREAIGAGVKSQKGIQGFVKARLGTDDEVAPKMISEVKKGLNGHSATE